jgi:hypothetical protein
VAKLSTVCTIQDGQGRDSALGGVDLLSGEGGGEGSVGLEEWIFSIRQKNGHFSKIIRFFNSRQ